MSDGRPWWREAVFYQVYVSSFADADGDGVGDLQGLIERLDYLRAPDGSGLGVDALWLSPVYRSPMADRGYDVSDYRDVDPLFGSMDDLERLLAEAHLRGLRVILDWVPNHTSDRHPWFQESRSSRSSGRRDWYVWRDPGPGGGPPNNWLSSFPSVGGAWTPDPATGQWYLHSFLPQQPDLNWENPEVRAEMHDVLRFWLDRGVDGFRIDVAHKLGKDPELRDNLPPAVRPGPAVARLRHDQDWAPAVDDRLREIREVLSRYPGRMTVGEVYLLDQRRVVEYLRNEGLDLAHNFVLIAQPWDAARIRHVIEEFERLADPSCWPSWFFSNHDHPRAASRFAEGDPRLGVERARAAAVLLLTLRGTPFLYQGEELGLPDVPIAEDRTSDIDGRDPCRTPLPWLPPLAAGPGAGFTDGEPWLPVGDLPPGTSVADQRRSPASMLNLYRGLLRVRAASPALKRGSITFRDVHPDVLAYDRRAGDDFATVAVNFSKRVVRPTGVAADTGLRVVASSAPQRTPGEAAPDHLLANEAMVLMPEVRRFGDGELDPAPSG